ncbi:hypothetical protein WJX81_000189 [Elliptochloris bilobata]|uniref:Rieske domain-containing protein n=1 Tax=Elliptochloris bilobata TaxID=381761 RepID=A0AAW1RQN4_9CHLO
MKEPRRFSGIRNTASVDGAVPGLARNVWDQHKLRAKYPQLKENISADVCVVGGGIAGLSIAYNLAKAGKSVVVLESRTRGSGQTGRTTAHLMLWNDDYYHLQEQNFNLDTAKVLAESHRQAIDWVAKTVEEEGIDCHFHYVDGYLFPHTAEPSTAETLDKELGAAVRAGLTDVRKVNLENDPAAGLVGEALLFPRCGDFHPLMYLEGLADAITKNGGRIFENTRVRQTEGKEVRTRDGFVVTAPNIVLATNPPIHHNMTIHARLNPQRSYVVGLQMPEGCFKPNSQFWSTATPYHYIRTESHPEHGEVMIVGGADHSSGIKPQEYVDRFDMLESWARQRWPKAGKRVYEWSGMVYKPLDQVGLYGQDPGNDLQSDGTYYIAAGHSGQGMTGGTIAGIIISSQILGNQHPWSDVYSPSRLPAASTTTAQQLFEVSRTTIQAFTEVVLPGRSDKPGDLAPGEGAVQQAGKDKVAVYKDEAGVEHTFAAACPHLGCLVQWNPLDGTFDCPCHGSIFTKEGKCINGPAVEDLKPVKIGTFGLKEDKEAAIAQGGKTF